MPAILVHGGAGNHVTGCRHDRKVFGVRQAADAGWAVLSAGGSALDAVEAATRVLEEDPCFDAGVGSFLNQDGDVELDAIIMDGQTLKFGAVAAVRRVRNPISVARLVMRETPHAFLVGRGAERLADKWGLTVAPAELVTPEALAAWKEARSRQAAPVDQVISTVRSAGQVASPERHERQPIQTATPTGDTVGAVAVDVDGHVAAATSTGGTHDKLPGRVGDSPIVGAGGYADDRTGAVSCTGHGESIMRICLAYAASQLLAGTSAQAAAEQAIQVLTDRTGGPGGLIVVSATGQLGWAYNTKAMPYAWKNQTGAGAGI